MRILIIFLILFSGFLATIPAAVPADAADCQFVLGFKKLHDALPNIVGNCLEDARFDTGLGETLQATTGTRTDGKFGGLLVWRNADNLTFFTNGTNTWIDTPQGIQTRLNTQRFPWELDSVANTAYVIDGMPFVLNDGQAKLNTDQPTVVRLTAALDENNVAYGDLNGDGVTDAAVRLVINTGGSGVFNYLVAMVSSDGTVRQAASVLLGDRVIVNGVSISGGAITVNMITQGPDDPLCCPTLPKTVNYRLVGGNLVEVAQ